MDVQDDMMHLTDLEHGKLVDGNAKENFEPPDDFDMEKFCRGRRFFKNHLFSCSIGSFFSLIVGLNIPSLLEALLFTGKSGTPHKALKRYLSTFRHVALWHYGNVWDKNSDAHKSIMMVRTMHDNVRTSMTESLEDVNKLFLSQYDLAIVQSGFMGAVCLYPYNLGISCTVSELDDYVYFWYGIGHLLGIIKDFNICAHGYFQAVTFCKEIEDLMYKNYKTPHPMFHKMASAVVSGFTGNRSLSLISVPVVFALSFDSMSRKRERLGIADTVRYMIWKCLFFSVRSCSTFRKFIHGTIERAFKLFYDDF